MILIGIDYSNNNPAICIKDEDNKYRWFAISLDARNYILSDIEKLSDVEIYNNIEKTKKSKKLSYIDNERILLKTAMLFSNIILDNAIKNYYKNDNIKIAIEGYSYGGVGNSLLDLVTYQSILRSNIILKYNIPLNNIYIYSPQSIKSFADVKQRKDKKALYYKFLEYDDDNLKNTDFYLWCLNNKEKIEKLSSMPKPIDDYIDAFFILKKLESDVI